MIPDDAWLLGSGVLVAATWIALLVFAFRLERRALGLAARERTLRMRMQDFIARCSHDDD